MKLLLCVGALFFIVPCAALGQSGELSLRAGVVKHSGIDAIYRDFSESYKTLNVERLVDLYTESAAYLAPNDDVTTGRENIRPGFKRFFDSVKASGQSMTISFDILQRRVENNIGYDVGIFTLRNFKDGKEINKGQGKFVVVAVKESDGKWRFQVDGYSDLKPAKAN